MKNLIRAYFLLLIICSCQKTNDYYSDVDKPDRELVNLGEEKRLRVSFSAIKDEESLELSIYIKSLDRTINLDNIDLQINGLERLDSKKRVFYSNIGESFNFNTFTEIRDDFNNQVQTGTSIIIRYIFEDHIIKNIDDLNFKVTIKSNLGFINKKITMKRHSRYKFFME
jgi:hypothetical protein